MFKDTAHPKTPDLNVIILMKKKSYLPQNFILQKEKKYHLTQKTNHQTPFIIYHNSPTQYNTYTQREFWTKLYIITDNIYLKKTAYFI